jgi:HSP20 family protein
MSKCKPLVRIDDWMIPVFRNEFQGPFDDLFNDTINRFLGDFGTLKSFNYKHAYPKVDVYKEDTDLVFNVAVPGLTKDKVSIEILDGILTIKGDTTTKLESVEEEKENISVTPYIMELKHSSFVRRFILPDNITAGNMNTADASLENGILKVIFKDVYKEIEPPKPKVMTIPIK